MASHAYLPIVVKDDEDWRNKAACLGHDPDLWFTPQGSPEMVDAKNICATCPVRNMCLNTALDIPEPDDWGVLGGLDKAERGRLRRKATA